MSEQELFTNRLLSGPPLLLDAAMGTELERHGLVDQTVLWSARALLDSPDTVRGIHAADVAAGADILTTNTFRTHRRSLEAGGLWHQSAELNRRAVALAREAAAGAGRPIFVAGSVSSLEDCYRPDLVPDDATLAREHWEQARALAEAGVDAIFLETHHTVRELVAAARAAKAFELPVVASLVTDGTGHLLSGESIEEAVAALDPIGPEAMAINCVPARALLPDLQILARARGTAPIGAWGNFGRPRLSGEGFDEGGSPEQFAEIASTWLNAGARLVGGCCGTSAAHTARLRKLIDTREKRG